MIRVYDICGTYQENYELGPGADVPAAIDLPKCPVSLFGLEVDFPLGISAGPLLNARWIEAYANLGYSILTYKTVRSMERPCYSMPNMIPITGRPKLQGLTISDVLEAADTVAPPIEQSTWTVSYGMPSTDPEIWKEDARCAKEALRQGQILIVAVVGTPREGWGIDELFDDYAQCALWAKEAGADVVETNLSCPNVTTSEGQIYRSAEDSVAVCSRIRERIGATPFVVKIGAFSGDEEARQWLDSVAPFIDGVVTLNTLSRTVHRNGKEAFPGRPVAGVTGAGIADAARDCVRQMVDLREKLGLNLAVMGVGGVMDAEGFAKMRDVGADAVLVATGAMLIPDLAIRIRRYEASHP
ncbi:MAG: dihydroorotate dehydrogenase [bacterium]